MKPDWESDCGTVRLWNADCLEVLPTWEAGAVGAIVTDPPYGINWLYDSYVDSFENWVELMLNAVPAMLEKSRFVVMPSCAISRLKWWYDNIPPEWIICWYQKAAPARQSKVGFNTWQALVCWGRPETAMHDHFTTTDSPPATNHPCPKPIGYGLWLVNRAVGFGGTIGDPMMGSGSTGVAAVRLGRSFWGCEIDAGYFETAKRRIQDELERVRFLEPKREPRQMSLIER